MISYSFGITLWEMIFRKNPFNIKQNEIYMIARIVKENQRPEISGDFTIKYPKIVELLNKCWLSNAKERPNMSTIVELLEEIQIELNQPSSSKQIISNTESFISTFK